MFQGCINLFLGVGCVLDIFCLSGAFWSFTRLIGVFWSSISNRGYFGLFQSQGVLRSFSMSWGGAWVIFDVLGVFQSFIRIWGYIGLFLGIGDVLDIFLCLQRHCGHHFNLWCILLFFDV